MLSTTTLYYLSEWVIRLVMLVYVPQRRNPAAARSWLLFIFILPWPGLVLYALFGRAYLPQRRLQIQHQVSQLIRAAGHGFFSPFAVHPRLPERYEQVVMLAENLGDFPIVDGNQIELLADYDGAIDRLVADIDAAQHHVHLLYYIFADDRVGRRVADALITAARRGVACRVLCDAFGSISAFRRLRRELRAAGVDVRAALPVKLFRRSGARFDLRNHRKLALIDGRVAYVGSQNIVAADFKPSLVYEELVARIRGPVVMQLQAVFLTDRLLETEEDLVRTELFPDPQVDGEIAAQVLPSGPGYQQANLPALIVALLHAARRRIVITTPYFVPDEALLQALQSAVMRGVQVDLVVPRSADQYLVCFAQRSYYEDLLRAGVRIFEYQPRFLHAKHITIDDDVALIGSSNLDLRSFLLNAEITLIVYDPQVAQQLREIEERNIALSTELTLTQWNRRPLPRKVLQNMARLIDALL
ncbi:MAG: cardiolipin synthase [Pirellulales bacterium]|nr:cardiolipin synthase [Pirellulales bacterium]